MRFNKNARLLRRGKPKAGESFIGYLVRMTEMNGYDTPSWILSLSAIDYMELQWKFTFIFSRSKHLKRFAEITGSTEEELLTLLYLPSQLSKVYKNTSIDYNFYGASFNRSIIRPHCPKVCPTCLLESGYCLRIWDCSLVTTCPFHKCMLIDTCPRCNNRITCIRNRLSICFCGQDWREAPLKIVSDDELALSHRVYDLCGLMPTLTDSTMEASKNPLYKLDLRDLVIVITFIAGLYGNLSWAAGTPTKSIEQRNKDLHQIYIRAYSVFERWPDNFYQFLEEQSTGEVRLNTYDGRLDTALKKEFHSFYKGLYKKLAGSQYDFMRNFFVEFLTKRWKHSSSHSYNAVSDSAPYKVDRYISVGGARRLLKINHQSLYDIIKTGGIEFIIQEQGSSLTYLLLLSDVIKNKTLPNQTAI